MKQFALLRYQTVEVHKECYPILLPNEQSQK